MRPTSARPRFILATRLFLLLLLSAASFARFAPPREDGRGQRASPGDSDWSRNRPYPGRDKYLVGVGKGDITGPVVDLNLAGYAQASQVGNGLRQRLYSRAFIMGDVKNPKERVIYVVMDGLVGDTAIRLGVLEGLKKGGAEYSVYGTHNIALAAVHSHATPGGWWNYFLPSIPNLGFDRQSYKALVEGTLLAIRRAHESLQEGYLDVGTTEIRDAAINRSLFAYLRNPEEERQRYQSDTDTTMTLLRLRRASDMKSIGLLTWFPVHGTSLYNNNTHVSGDNKGLASWMTEQALKKDDSAVDGFIAAFSQANLGDASPNTEGAWCEDGSGQMCNFQTASCPNGKVTGCHGRGPMFREKDQGTSSCHEIARRQATAATELLRKASMDSSSTPIVGTGVKGFHFFHNMAWWNFTLPNGTQVTTCPGALGYSFAAGTTDGPGLFDFVQGEANRPRNPLWKIVFGFLRIPTARQIKCQSPKPILFDGGEQTFPYAWEPNVVDISMFRIGQLLIILSPSEVTTMSGRRWKAAVAREATNILDTDPVVVIASPVNTYAHYLTTPEEYAVQRYEGASTIFGPHALNAYINLTVGNMRYLEPGSTDLPGPGPLPPDNRKKAFNFNFVFKLEGKPLRRSFGDVIQQPNRVHRIGDNVQATFQGASPRNNLRLEQTFAAVEQLGPNDRWTPVRDDSDWFLVYTWRATNKFLGYSEVDVRWETKGNAEPGTYRFKYYGDSKALMKKAEPFQGTSEPFELGQ
ncbi:neutral ceramidase [Hirsutella rhossiliensis]|uniref:Neutral ceramidase n=1 Tax=Hirsutella rhossiliensis TaxID=111463 RepID=A0A9P8SHJ9_9HYPO|nr:neutral ceramidase [Hirsutella rhossiliensis]KAH0962239.1 neutral ceramidase [Hirsutella rhossiliensis]